MLNFHSSESDLLKAVLVPLLEDFQYWFERSQKLLEAHEIQFLGSEKQRDLLSRVKQAQQEVHTIQMLMQATEGQVGVETGVLIPWHQLVTECWQVAIRFRSEDPPE
ncbi:hypothetical protein BST81_04320 [Leptolyngbya sp. 'hensonii']|uniref:DUF2605 domain-containing protein n=1 Tax=Leptolyngbya sp. 'hensonii' TaxID=1922337 RepID=UPI00094F8AD6|nr:DUF2605 domain-containing protein [Leptolyngbya sp. 'hensonii']OLP19765.1 hypothetical protein BST81_04320 [Leptolyngbya sp. 'hensonii']